MEIFKRLIAGNLSGKKILILFILTNVVYALMLTFTIPKTMTYSKGMDLFDMMPMGYDHPYALSLLSTLGEAGRDIYLYNQIPLDLVYPFLFGISYCLIFAFFLNRINKIDSALFYLCLLPLIAGVADYLENAGIISMLVSYPDVSPGLVQTTSTFSVIKSMSTTLFFIALIGILIALGIKSLNAKS
jgi:hypothetical protein